MTQDFKKDVRFDKKMLIIGGGFIGQGVLPLILKHIDIKPEQISIITADERGKETAAYYGIPFSINPISKENYREVLDPLLSPGDFLLNLSSDIESTLIVDFCSERGILYLDTCIDSWLGESTNPALSVSQRSLYKLREQAIKLKEKWGNTNATSVLAHGANPGIVSHLVKQALLNIAKDEGRDVVIPQTREEWARLSQSLGIRAIHVAERDTQIPTERKKVGEFINTWSIDGLVGEGLQPAELGWGSHEKHLPVDGSRHTFGDQSAIYLNKPGASVRVRTWLPLAGPQIGYLITHNEAISLASYLTLGTGENPEYRPTVHYAYHPCDDAVLSITELEESNWKIQEQKRSITDEIVSGIDELGVLLIGNKQGVYWFGSRLDIHTARQLAPYNSATSLQVAAGVVAGMIWAMRHPESGIVEAEEMDFREVLDIASPYWGELVGEYSDWDPTIGRNTLFPEDIDTEDPWQFKNFRVV
ncbi:MAG: saccharopine dehydrogenase NADP-binding domain-containing protein [Candidatus Moranbacteria bacterium]|nr:saccharopine dehydrogenase NADP-binding domain-containing protein [Candidatus Moranbacteria bacterium]MDD3964827.1 saccharopine dehydrogenase NADP-binding domain-containing protein [Candidatus Moranbacteria bacterium]